MEPYTNRTGMIKRWKNELNIPISIGGYVAAIIMYVNEMNGAPDIVEWNEEWFISGVRIFGVASQHAKDMLGGFGDDVVNDHVATILKWTKIALITMNRDEYGPGRDVSPILPAGPNPALLNLFVVVGGVIKVLALIKFRYGYGSNTRTLLDAMNDVTSICGIN